MVRKTIVMALVAAFIFTATFAFADDVYATKNGKKYHKAECQLIKNKKPAPIAKEDAAKKGLTPCQRCFKEDLGSKKLDAGSSTKISSSKKKD
ncbi:MAG: hypothetical protein HQL27_03995 [Candidatus Omnitrophica bacterium]|nr:hypothetical protein [Candidatus Omnitrophota bacterium]